MCRNLTDGKSPFCTYHQDLVHAYDRSRSGDPIRRMYGVKRWLLLRQAIFFRDPICTECKQWISEVVDHRIPARQWIKQHDGDMNSFFDEGNLFGLCIICHNSKSAREK